MIVDFTLLDPHLTLTLECSRGGFWSVYDQAGRMFYPPSSYGACVRFMEAFAAKEPGTTLVFERSSEEPKASSQPRSVSQAELPLELASSAMSGAEPPSVRATAPDAPLTWEEALAAANEHLRHSWRVPSNVLPFERKANG